MNDPVSITAAESEVMEVIWRKNPIAAEDVLATPIPQGKWQDATIKTLLNRLLKKGAIRASKEGRRYLYSPALQRSQWVLAESRGLLDRLFGGRIAPLVSHFNQERKLSRKDVADLKRLIQEIEDER